MLLWELRGPYTIREECIFMLMGRVVAHALTEEMFAAPTHKEAADDIEGRYG